MEYSINKKLEQSTMTSIHLVTESKKKQSSVQRKINIIFVILEFAMYVYGYIQLFRYKVTPELNFWNLHQFYNSYDFNNYSYLLILVLCIYSFLMFRNELFSFQRKANLLDDVFKIIKISVISFLLTTGLLFIMKNSIVFSRALIIMFCILMTVVAIVTRILKIMTSYILTKMNYIPNNVLIIGYGKVGKDIERIFTANKFLGYRLVGFIDDAKKGEKILGGTNSIEDQIKRYSVDEVFITIPSEKKIIQSVISKIRKYNVAIKIIPEMYDLYTKSLQPHRLVSYPFLELIKSPLIGLNAITKRIFDVLFSTLGIFIISPLLFLIAIMIKLDSKGPVFFKQRRIGKNGVPFNMYKFRSMVTDAEELKQKLDNLNEADGPVFKIKDDPRVTRFGRFIRKYSIDELPQLFNVIRGDMSLIGPRPPLPSEVEQYTDVHWRRLDVLPGITGLWQVSGRSDLSFEEWVNLDIYYIENWSISLEIKILLRTIPVVLLGKGAY